MITLYTADQFALCFVYIYYIERLALWSPFYTAVHIAFCFVYIYYIVRLALWSPFIRLST